MQSIKIIKILDAMNVGVDRKRLSTILNILIQAFLPTNQKLEECGHSQMEKMTLLMFVPTRYDDCIKCLKILSGPSMYPKFVK